MDLNSLFNPMNTLDTFKALQGKTIAYAGIPEPDSDSSLVCFITDDQSVLIASAFDEGRSLSISPVSYNLYPTIITSSEKFRKVFIQHGLFKEDAYNEMIEQRIALQRKQQEMYTLERERAEYERLKAKFETNGDV